MNKTEIISEIINICDKAEQYDRLMVTQVNAVAPEPEKPENHGRWSGINAIIKKIGKKHVVDEVVSDYWASVSVSKNEETGVIDVQSYESWTKQYVKNVPDYISRQDFLSYFNAELREKYDAKRSDALKRYEEE